MLGKAEANTGRPSDDRRNTNAGQEHDTPVLHAWHLALGNGTQLFYSEYGKFTTATDKRESQEIPGKS